jgi:signal transduction histidine kinase
MKSEHLRINKNLIRADLITDFTHELKTPVASVKEAISLLTDIKPKNYDEKTKHILSIAQNEINRIVKMIDNLSEISLLESRKIRLHREKTNINEIINHIIESHSLTAHRKSLHIQKNLALNLPKLFLDKDRISEVISNLLDNAIKFTPENGTIIIRTEILAHDQFNPRLDTKQDYIKFVISNTGSAISKKDLSRIFQKFVRLETKHKIRGTGLGLAIAQDIIELHKGKIWATSEIGHGARFHFIIPVKN